MVLTVMERLLLLDCVPRQADILTLRVVGDLKKNLGFTEDELALYKLSNDAGGHITWDASVSPQEKDIPIGEKATDVIVRALKSLNDSKKLTEAHIPLWEKFIKED